MQRHENYASAQTAVDVDRRLERPAARRHTDRVTGIDAETRGVLGGHVERLAAVQRREIAAALHARVERLQPAAGGENERVLVVRLLDRTFVMDDGERREAAALGRIVVPEPRVEELRSRVLLVGTRPLNAVELFETLVGHARELRRERADFVPHVFRRRRTPVVAEALGELRHDPDLVASFAGWFDGLSTTLNATLAVRDRALPLGPRRCRGQHDVGELRGFREEDFLHDEVVEILEEMDHVRHVGVRLRRILADDVERGEFLRLHSLDHLGEMPPILRDDVPSPRALELRAVVVGGDVLETGELVGQRAHVAAALDVVLSAERVAPAPVASDVSGEERQVDEREHVVDGVVVLGDAERPADHGAVGRGVCVRRVADDLGGDSRDALAEAQRIGFYRFFIGLIVSRSALDELGVGEPGVDDLARHGVGERDIGADVEAEPHVGPFGGRGAPRIDDVETRAVLDPLQ